MVVEVDQTCQGVGQVEVEQVMMKRKDFVEGVLAYHQNWMGWEEVEAAQGDLVAEVVPG